MNIQKASRKKRLIITLILVSAALIIAALGLFYWYTKQSPKSSINGIDYNPPTKDQKDSGEQIKEDSNTNTTKNGEQPEPTDSPKESGKTSVPITIVDASQYGDNVEVRAYVSNVTETGGSCTIVFTKGDSRFERSSSTIVSANSTQCSNTSVPVTDFPSLGTWSVRVTYNSSNSSGTSDSKTVEVQ